MKPSDIDPVVFADLQAQAGADFVAELVETFADEGPTLLAALRAAAARSDSAARRRAAHSIKSNASTFGARELAEAARAIELAAVEPATEALDALGTAFDAAVRSLHLRARALR